MESRASVAGDERPDNGSHGVPYDRKERVIVAGAGRGRQGGWLPRRRIERENRRSFALLSDNSDGSALDLRQPISVRPQSNHHLLHLKSHPLGQLVTEDPGGVADPVYEHFVEVDEDPVRSFPLRSRTFGYLISHSSKVMSTKTGTFGKIR